MKKSDHVEILAPAGSPESLIAAVRCSADAVYLGEQTLNARRGATNFDAEQIKQAVRYCHARGVKVYLVLNTLVHDFEIEEAIKITKRACAVGIDALILQDLGLAKIIRQAAPDMPLHASTQMSVQTPAGLWALKDLGFTRAILPRELSFEETAKLAENAPLELEVFVHGALCMSVSGQCTMSAMLGSRSANRGLCAGPCRLPFSAKNGTGFDLSLKDLSLISHLKELEKLGICAFKIEGRMKRPEYVAAGVTACRKSLSGEFTPEDAKNLQAVFSRSGFTQGYYLGERGKGMFGTRQKDDVTAAADVLSSFAELYKNENPLIPVDFVFTCKADEPLSLSAGALGRNIFAISEEFPQPAKKRPIDKASIEEQLNKCGGTPFFADQTEIDLDDGLYVPLSAINALRREALEKLNDALEQGHPIAFTESAIQEIPPHEAESCRVYARFSKASQIPSGTLSQTSSTTGEIQRLIIPLDTPTQEIKMLMKTGLEIAVEIPRGIFGSSERIVNQLEAAKTAGVKIACAATLGAMELARRQGFLVHAGLGSNIFNSQALEALKRSGVSEATLSFELTLAQVAALKGALPRGLTVYGRLPLMLTRNCPVSNGISCKDCGGQGEIVDRLDIRFPVVCKNGCAEVLNSRPLYMADRLGEMNNIDFIVLYFTTETKEECEAIIKDYRDRQVPQGEYTRGLYYRGVE